MSQNCNSLIKENKNLITDFKENFEKKIIIYNHQNIIYREEGQSDYIENYVANIYSKIYIQINQTIILLDVDKCTIIEKPILIKQLHKLYRLFFDYLENSEYKSDYWKLFEWQEQNIFDYKYSFIDPKDFNAEFVGNLIKSFIKNFDYKNEEKVETVKQEKITLEKDWLEVAYNFANGKIYDLYNNGKGLSFAELNSEIFKEKASDNYRHYIHHTLLGTITKANKQKNIFKRTKAEAELNKVLKYCKQEGITVCDNFYQDCYKNEIDIIKPT